MAARRPKSSRVVGVAIDGDILRGVEIRRWLGRIRVRRFAEVAIDAHAIEAGRVVDAEAVTAALTTLWQTARFSTKRVIFGLDGREATLRPISIARAAADDLDSAVCFELADYLPYGLDEAVTAHRVVGSDDTDLHVLGLAVRAEVCEEIAQLVSDAGLRLVAIEPAPTALADVVGDAESEHMSEAVVAVDGSHTTVVLRTAGTPLIVRVLSTGGGDRSRELADELDQMLASVDQFRYGQGGEAPGAQLERFREAVDAVVGALQYASTESPNAAMERVVLSGRFGEEAELHQLLGGMVSVPAVAADAPSAWEHDEPAGRYITAIGLAHSSLDDADHRFALQAPSVVARRLRHREVVLGITAAACVAGVGMPLVDLTRHGAEESELQAAQIEADADRAAIGMDRLEAVRVRLDDLEAARLNIDEAVDAELWWPRILEEIAESAPDDTFLTSASLLRPAATGGDADQVTVSLAGVGLEQESVGRWLLAMAELSVFDNVWLVQSTSGVYGVDEAPVVTFLVEAELTDVGLTPRARLGSEALLAPLHGAEAEGRVLISVDEEGE